MNLLDSHDTERYYKIIKDTEHPLMSAQHFE